MLMAQNYYEKMKELEKLKNIQIEKRKNNIYQSELSLLKDKQRDIYNDFILDYHTKKDELELKYQNILEKSKKMHDAEYKTLTEKNSKNNNKQLNSKKLLILEDKMKRLIKMKLLKSAEKIKKEINIEKDKLKLKYQNEQNIINKIKINNLKKIQNKKKNKILLNYNKEKNDLEISLNKEKNELFKRFKNQLNEFEMFNRFYIKQNKNFFLIILNIYYLIFDHYFNLY